MPETARIIRVFVSSPGDVSAERDVLKDVVDSINQVDGDAGGFRLELFRWEENVAPKIGPKPQRVVDDQTAAYDIYVGIMSTRFGTPTGRYGSGSEKEFRDALKAWKKVGAPWITFYFDAQPKLTGDPEQAEQFVKVCKFKKSLEKQGITATYQGVDGGPECFYKKVDRHLRRIVRLLNEADEPPQNKRRPRARGSPGKPKIPSGYLQWLQEDCAGVDLLGLQVQHGQAIKLNHVYVPLTTNVYDEVVGDGIAARIRLNRDVQLLIGLLEEDSLYVAGAAGSGKSTFSRWVAWLACEGRMPPAQIPAPHKYQEQFPESFAGRLPLLVRLREFWSHLPLTPGCRDLTDAQLRAALAAWIDATQPGGLTSSVFESHLADGKLLLILDGVDEVPLSQGEGSNQCQPRALLLSGLGASLPSWSNAGSRVLLTSRPYGLTDQERGNLGIPATTLGDLDEAMQGLLVRRWFACLNDRLEAGEAKAREMLGHVANRPDVQALSANPMLLTAVCILYHQGERLPQGRYDLYDRIVDNVLCNRFPEDRQVIDPVRNRLAVVAYGMHTGEGLGEERTTPQAKATFSEIDRMLQSYQDQKPWAEPGFVGALQAREELLSRTGLLLPRGGNEASFYHFTLQDFLAARRLLDHKRETLFDEFRQRGRLSEWKSTLTFVFGAQLVQDSSPARSVDLLGGLVESLDDVVLAVVVGECIQILGKHGAGLLPELEERFRRYCVNAIGREVPLQERHQLGLMLGHLGDPRIVTDLRDRAAYVEIPGETYRIGGDEKAIHSLKQEAFELREPLLLFRYPVTNAQYALFIAEGGYEQQLWWSEPGWKWRTRESIVEPKFWQNSKWNCPNQPVVGVSYWEAEAFAKWAGGRLPSEREWEAAARGLDGLVYPWGDEWEDGICNSAEPGLGETSAVGLFPRSRTASGLDDMAGNVFEWCQDAIGDSEGDPASAGRVISGGGWYAYAPNARPASRITVPAFLRIDYVGFRCRVP